jgi:hypothetical protein
MRKRTSLAVLALLTCALSLSAASSKEDVKVHRLENGLG